MNNYKKLLCIITLCFLANQIFAKSENFYRIFWNPTFNGQRLNYCLSDNSQCGKPVADAFCKKLKYPAASKFMKLNNAGYTFFLDKPLACKGWECNSFKMIACQGKVDHDPAEDWHYQYKKFVYPRYQNYRVAWCYNGDSGCGRKAAFSFCRKMGFLDVKSFTRQGDLGATRAIGNEKLCFKDGCSGFSVINCKR